MALNQLAKEIHDNAVAHGFYEDIKNTGEMLCLIHAEVSEALEADRKNKYCEVNPIGVLGWVDDIEFKDSFNRNIKGTFEEEMADILIRVLDMCEYRKINIDAHVLSKMRYNKLREYKHSKKY